MILQNSIALGGSPAPAAYQIERSLRFNSADSAYLNWTPPQAGNRKTFTISLWFKRSGFGVQSKLISAGSASSAFTSLEIPTDNTFKFLYFDGSSVTWSIQTTQVFRDPSAWAHLVIAVDTTQSTASNRLKMYINGAQVTALTATYPSQNADTHFNAVTAHQLGNGVYNSTEPFNGYITEVNFIDGQALTPSDFGETSSSTGVWIPKAYTGSYGQNGFYLPFNDNSTVLNLGRNRQTLTADPYFPYTTLLLNGNGTNGAQNNTFLDSSTNNFTITRNGNTTQGTFSPFSQSGWSGYFNGSTDYLLGGTSSDYTLGTGDYCIEFWMYGLNTSSSSGVLGLGGAVTGVGTVFVNAAGGTANIRMNAVNGTAVTTANNAWSANQWTHVAITRASGFCRIFVNGVLQAYAAQSDNLVGTDLSIGRSYYNLNQEYFSGYLSNVRLVKGSVPTAYQTSATATGTSVFTPPTAALTDVTNTKLLTLQANRFVDTNTQVAAKTITVNGTPSVQPFSPFTPTAAYSAATNGGSGYFDGNGDFLTAPASSSWLFNGDACIEAWVYRAADTDGIIFATGGASSADQFAIFVSEGLWWGLTSQTGLPKPRINTWAHCVVTRSGSTIRRFIDGVLVSTGTNASAIGTSSSTAYIGSRSGVSNYFNGYISGLRVINGSIPTSYQTSSTTTSTQIFTPPTAPFTTTSQGATSGDVKLLLNFTNAGIIDATGDTVLETAGNAQISTAQSKWGGGSLAFDGTGDYLNGYRSGEGFYLGTTFTIEMWLRPSSVTGTQTLICFGVNNATNQGFNLYMNGAAVQFDDGNTGGTGTSGGTLAINTWTHVAIVANGSTTRIFIDGVLASTYNAVSLYGNVWPYVTIGIAGSNKSTGTFNGFIDDIRITKGLARYTGNFTVPAAQFAYNQADINVKQWVPNNFSVTAGVGNDSLVDSPTNYGTDTGVGGEVRGNYCTLNPLETASGIGGTLTNGNLQMTGAGVLRRSTFEVPLSGKWYAEMFVESIGSGAAIAYDSRGATGSTQFIQYDSSGSKNISGSSSAYGASYTTNDAIGIAADLDNGNITFYKNGVSQGAITISSASMTGKSCTVMLYTNSGIVHANFGQRPFAYTAPSGFKALNTQNLPTPAIGASSTTLAGKYFNVVTWTGSNTAAGNSVTGVGFSPDFVWSKPRSVAYQHNLYDVIRGSGKRLISNSTAAEETNAAYGYLSSFDSDGFTTSAGATNNENWNQTSATYVAWNWKANGAGSSNTAGSITSTVSVNTTAGISILTYTGTGTGGATVGHGLGVAPKMIITKARVATGLNWAVYHASLGATKNLWLSLADAVNTQTVIWNDTAPSSTVFTVGSAGNTNSTQGMVAYCFAEIAGFSRFGSYTGNGSADGPFVYCGFRPRWILIKSAGTANGWALIDTARSTINVSQTYLEANTAVAEGSVINWAVDILSNGFKIRSGAYNENNGSGTTYIFAAFAESPFNYSRAR